MAGDTVDASIPLGYKFPQLPTAQSVAAAQQMQYRNQLAQLQVQDAQQQAQQKNAVLQLFQQPGAVDPQTGLPTDATIGKVSQVNPDMGVQLKNSVVATQQKQQQTITNNINQRLLGMNINDRQHDKMVDIATSAQDLYDNLLASGTSPQEAAEQAGRQRNQQITDANKTGAIPNDVATTIQGPFNPTINKAFIAGSPQYKTVLAERAADTRAKIDQERESRLDANSQRAADSAGQDPFMKEAAATYGTGTPEYKQAIKDHLAKESGSTGAAGGREAVYTNRILSSANLATKDIANIARGPISQSSGFFGGRTPGPSLLDAGKESLANMLTPQEAQTYNVKIAGVQRNLAAIEAQGLAPSGSLTHQMDAIRFSATDTNWTKAYKLAEMRQIVDGGMDTLKANSRTDPGAKKLADQVSASIKQAVPFTVEDVDNLYNSKDSKATLSSFIKKKQGAPAAGDGPAKPASKAEYDALPSGTHVILPNGKEGVKP